ncbi:MAG: DUF4350 domain-containing protein [Streptosporangiales bacterium]|nr:DUF4350 domain-containing protein [Streptosporangiales bacterium]
MSTATETRSEVIQTLLRWRWPAGLALLVIVAGAVIALLQPSQTVYLDPNSTASDGGHALSDLLAARGQPVIREIANAQTAHRPGVELITGADQFSAAQLAQAARFGGDIVVTDPDPAALRVLAPSVTTDASGTADALTAPPLCNDKVANLAGNIDAGGAVLRTGDSAAASCYPAAGGYFYVRYFESARHRTVTVLGGSGPLTNAELGGNGDASLALNLLRGSEARPVTWLLPQPGAIPATVPPGHGGGNGGGQAQGQRSFTSLVPWPAYLIVIQLLIALVLAAAWRARRLGPLVAEKLPVVVRASETVEGHGRLYTARRARDRAAAELRAAAAARLSRRAGVSGGGTEAIARAIAARAGEDPDTVARLLGGPAPASDQELVALADDLDELERKVRRQ